MKKTDFDDLDEMIAELEDSLGVNTSEYLEDDYLDTIGAFGDDDEFDLDEFDELGDEFEDFDDNQIEQAANYDDDDFDSL